MRITPIALAAGVAFAVTPVLAQETATDSDVRATPEPISEREFSGDEARPTPAPAPEPTVVPTPVVLAPDYEKRQDRGVLSRAQGLLGEPISVRIGIGSGDFLGDDAREATLFGGTWDARAILGADSLIGVEAAYVGSARGIEGFGVAEDAAIVSNGLEGAIRIAAPLLTGNVDLAPFLIGGLGWEHYTLVGEGTNTAGIEDDDSVLTVPVGLGMQLGTGNFNFDARAMYKHAFDAEMFGPTTGGFLDEQNMNSWNISLGAGLSF